MFPFYHPIYVLYTFTRRSYDDLSLRLLLKVSISLFLSCHMATLLVILSFIRIVVIAPRHAKNRFYLCENKDQRSKIKVDKDQLCSNRRANMRLCFRYRDICACVLAARIVQFPCSLYATLSSVTAGRFVSRELVGNPEDRFSGVAAHVMSFIISRNAKLGSSNIFKSIATKKRSKSS